MVFHLAKQEIGSKFLKEADCMPVQTEQSPIQTGPISKEAEFLTLLPKFYLSFSFSFSNKFLFL
jgi:hypothetical protein